MAVSCMTYHLCRRHRTWDAIVKLFIAFCSLFRNNFQVISISNACLCYKLILFTQQDCVAMMLEVPLGTIVRVTVGLQATLNETVVFFSVLATAATTHFQIHTTHYALTLFYPIDFLRYFIDLLFFFSWGESECTWYSGHCLACCTSPG
jgi:hypothetical protein